CLRDHSGFDVW
nr:immunoglobulin heavy chain junction region [Macaca mulatta]